MSEIPRGMQIMVQSLIKMLGLDPARVQNSIEDIGKSLNTAATEMATIRRQNQAIMAHLGIAETSNTELTLAGSTDPRPN
jgi:hypothetical protein